MELAETCEEEIALALIDVILPDLSATEVFERIKSSRPDIKVPVCSGFAQEGPAQNVLDVGADGFIQKPYNLARLREKLDEIRNPDRD